MNRKRRLSINYSEEKGCIKCVIFILNPAEWPAGLERWAGEAPSRQDFGFLDLLPPKQLSFALFYPDHV